MRPGSRVWFDVSYTRTQASSIGITRTVRRLFEEFRVIAASRGSVCEAVAYHSAGFRRVDLPPIAGPAQRVNPRWDGRVFRWLSGSVARRVIVLGLHVLPWPFLHRIWQSASERTFNALSRHGTQVRFSPGDVLILVDASWTYPAWQAARLARQQGAAVVLLVYDLMPIRKPQFCFALVPMLFQSWLVRMIGCSDAVLSISKATQDDLHAWVTESGVRGLELPPSRRFRLGSDAVSNSPQGDVRDTVNAFISCEGACFGAIGSFEPKKNYPLLLQVFEALWSRGETTHLLIAGRPTPECADFVSALQLHPQQGRLLLCLNDASDAEVAAIYERCTALLLPSLFEGFGLPLVEARTRGCRVIASNIPPFAELADEGVVLFESNSPSALEQAIFEAARLPAASRMPGFTWADSARQLATLLRELLSQRAALS